MPDLGDGAPLAVLGRTVVVAVIAELVVITMLVGIVLIELGAAKLSSNPVQFRRRRPIGRSLTNTSLNTGSVLAAAASAVLPLSFGKRSRLRCRCALVCNLAGSHCAFEVRVVKPSGEAGIPQDPRGSGTLAMGSPSRALRVRRKTPRL